MRPPFWRRIPGSWTYVLRIFAGRPEDDVDAELRFHLDERIAELTAQGLSPDAASSTAQEEFGDIGAVRAHLYDIGQRTALRRRRAAWWEGELGISLWSSARLSIRGLRRSSTLAVAAIAILAIGIGMATAMFTIVDAILFRRSVVRDEPGLAVMWTYHDPAVEQSVDRATLDRVRAESRTMREIAGVIHWQVTPEAAIDGNRTLVWNRTYVTSNFFDVLGVRPALGRLLRAEDDQEGAPPVTVISHAAWRTAFGGDSGIVGKHVVDGYGGTSYRIVGVAPPGFDYPIAVDWWLPKVSANSGMLLVARIAPGATVAAARTEFLALAQRLVPSYHYAGAKAIPFAEAIVGDTRPAVAAFSAAVALLLIIACVNVGNLMLLRVGARAHEFSVRRALGASAGTIATLVLAESAILSVAGGIAALPVADVLLHLLLSASPVHLPGAEMIQARGIPLLIPFGVTLLGFLTFGIVPAAIASAGRSGSSLQLGTRSGLETRHRSRTRNVLVAAQMALALIMLAGAGLVVRSFERLQHVDLGYRADHLSVLQLNWPQSRYTFGPSLDGVGEELGKRWRALPGVVSVTPIEIPPFLGPGVWQGQLTVEGQVPSDTMSPPWVALEVGGPEYFRTMGIPLIRGRGFLASDREDAPEIAVVSQRIANRYWPGEDPIGKQIRFGRTDSPKITIVGVAGDIRFRSIRDITPTVYVAWRQSFWQGTLAIRTTGTLASVLPALRQAASDVDPQLDLWRTETMDALLDGPLGQPRLNAFLLSGFGLTALLLAAVGLYGITAATVRERTRDIGVRMALGATATRVHHEVMTQALRTFGVGAFAGLLCALAMSRLLVGLLYDVSPFDPAAMLAACALLLVVATCAAYVPAWHATRIDPAKALREE